MNGRQGFLHLVAPTLVAAALGLSCSSPPERERPVAPPYPGVRLQQGKPIRESIAGAVRPATALVGTAASGPINAPTAVQSLAEFERTFGPCDPAYALSLAVRDFFRNGGRAGIVVRCDTAADYRSALSSLDTVGSFGVLCVLPESAESDVSPAVWRAALQLCVRRHAFLVVDPPQQWESAADVSREDLDLDTPDSRNAAVYFPRLIEDGEGVLPSGAVAGVIARTDAQGGIWKAPAGQQATINGIDGFSVDLTEAEAGALGSVGVNCLRSFPDGRNLVWGSRTLRGDDRIADEYRFVPVRRLALHIEESITQGLRWVVFEQNDQSLWARIRNVVSDFLQDLYRRGAFQGATPGQAYSVTCGRTTATQEEIDRGIVRLVVGFAPLKPVEFLLLRMELRARQTQP